MRKILVCQHVGYEILGTLNPLLKNAGFRIKYVNFGRFPEVQPGLEGYQGLILLGGPMNTDQEDQYPHLRYEISMIEEALKRDIPVLGICLGAQLVARALGASVGPNKEKEIGWYDVNVTEAGRQDPLLGNFQDSEKVFQWHGNTFQIPESAVHLATGSQCANQAFRYGDKVYAFQFHLEVDEPMVDRWLEVPRHKEEIAAQNGKIDPDKILQDNKDHMVRLMELSDATFGQFIKIFGGEKKFHRLSSR